MTSSASGTETGASEPELVTLEGATTAVVRGVVPTARLAGFFDRSFRAIPAAIAAQGITITGPAFAFFRGAPGETADLEVGFSTHGTVRAEGDVVASSLPAGRVARLVHSGAFDELGTSWARLESWIGRQGLTPAPVLWEVYLTEPSPDMDPRDLRTELNWPVQAGP